MHYTNSKAPSEKGIKATRAAVKMILEETVSLQMMFKTLSAAILENDIPIDTAEFQECAELAARIDLLVRRQDAGFDHMLANAHIESTVQRLIQDARFNNTGRIVAGVA